MVAEVPEEVRQKSLQNPEKRFGQADEIAKGVVYLCVTVRISQVSN